MSTSYPENMKVQLNLVPNVWPIEFFALGKKAFFFQNVTATGVPPLNTQSSGIDSNEK